MKSSEYKLYVWYPIVDDGDYWTDYDTSIYGDDVEKISTIVSNGTTIYTYEECPLGWSTMSKSGNWKFMRIKLD